MVSRSEERESDRERLDERKQGGQDGGIHKRCTPGRSEALARSPALNYRCGVGPTGRGQRRNVHVRRRQRPPRHDESPGPRQTAQERLRSWPSPGRALLESEPRPMGVRIVSSYGALVSIASNILSMNRHDEEKLPVTSTEEHRRYTKRCPFPKNAAPKHRGVNFSPARPGLPGQALSGARAAGKWRPRRGPATSG